MPCLPGLTFKSSKETDPRKRLQKNLKRMKSDRDRLLRCLKKAAKKQTPKSSKQDCCCPVEKVTQSQTTFVECPSSPWIANKKETKQPIKCKKIAVCTKPNVCKPIVKAEKVKKSKKKEFKIRRRVRRRRETRNMCCRCAICVVAFGVIGAFAMYWIPIYTAIITAI